MTLRPEPIGRVFIPTGDGLYGLDDPFFTKCAARARNTTTFACCSSSLTIENRPVKLLIPRQ